MLAQRMWLSGAVAGGAVGLLVGICIVVVCVCALMAGDAPRMVSVHGDPGKARVVDIAGTLYRLVPESRYAELRRYEWTAKHGL